ncbi:MAG: hypothetical protein IPN29_11830 [Saprospiraceae bacterium]|nr:hypothetical protein [Saprospiraceae bacterium]
MNDKAFFILASAIIVLWTCRPTSVNYTAASRPVEFLDSTKATIEITSDDGDNFFQKLTPIDAAIQMKDNTLLVSPAYLESYKDFLKTQVLSFSDNDKAFLRSVFDEATMSIGKLNPDLIPVKCQLVKIKTGHYGQNVYYTRGNTIFIPENIFINPSREVQLPIMIHELWHVISEQNPGLREQLYELIGFRKHGLEISFPSFMKDRLLTNPDGAKLDYALLLPDGKWVLPIILSGKNHYETGNNDFFNYLKFDLYGLTSTGVVEADKGGNSVLSSENHQEFFNAIKDNTQYIIHPDEIIADNFMLAVLANKNNDYKKFSAEGKGLILEIQKVLGKKK